MSSRRDPFWKYVVRKSCPESPDQWRWICNYCTEEFRGRPNRIKAHLGKKIGEGIRPCSSPNLPEDVRRQAAEAFEKKTSEPNSKKRRRSDTDSAVPEPNNHGNNNPLEAQQVSTQGDDSSCYIRGTREENFNYGNSTQEVVPSSSARHTFSGLQDRNYLTYSAQHPRYDREGEPILAQRGEDIGLLRGLPTTSNYMDVRNNPQPQLDSRREVPSSNPDHGVANDAEVHHTMSLRPAALPELDSRHPRIQDLGRKTIVNSFLNLPVPLLVGNEHILNLENIYRDLTLNDDINAIGIYGMGGVGKTALALNLHSRLCIDGKFGDVLWVTVPKDASMYELQEEIATELKVPGFLKDVKDARKRAAILWDQFLRRGKCTLFLDDVWKHFEIDEVGIPVGISGLKLVLTTQLRSISLGMQCYRLFKIEPLLSSEDCFALFKDHLKGRFLNSPLLNTDLVRTGWCGGLPLAVVAMARSIRRMTNVDDLHDSFERLEAKEGPEYEVIEKHLIQSLKRSYDVLPNDMKKYFLTCATKGEDDISSVEDTIDLLNDEITFIFLIDDRIPIDAHQVLKYLENRCLLDVVDGKVIIHNAVKITASHIGEEF